MSPYKIRRTPSMGAMLQAENFEYSQERKIFQGTSYYKLKLKS
jgi:hypothetical protein